MVLMSEGPLGRLTQVRGCPEAVAVAGVISKVARKAAASGDAGASGTEPCAWQKILKIYDNQ